MGEMGKRELTAALATSSGDGGFERRRQGLARARMREMGKRRNRWAGDVYACICSCRQCWASKCRGL
jgi:hypothetical protein